MSNKINIVSDISLCTRSKLATYCYRIEIDGEYLTGRGVFKKYTVNTTILETTAQEIALSHLMSWFTIPTGTSITMCTDCQGTRQDVKNNIRTGVVLRGMLDRLRSGGINAHLHDVKGKLKEHGIYHVEANKLRKLKSK